MTSVRYEFGDRERIAFDLSEGVVRSIVPEITLSNGGESSVGRLQFSYDRGSGFYKHMLSTVYAIAAGAPFQIYRPDWVRLQGDLVGGSRLAHALLARPDGEQLDVALVEVEDVLDLTAEDDPGAVVPVEWDPAVFEATVTVVLEEYVSAVVSATTEYIGFHEEHGGGYTSERVRWLLGGARTVRQEIRDASGVAACPFGPESPRVQTYLYDSSFTNRAVTHLLIESGIVSQEVERLGGQDDDIGRQYQTLLSHPSWEIQTAVASALGRRPDERATEWLLGRRWTDDPRVVPIALRAAAQIGGEDVREALLETLDFSEQPEIRRTAVTLLADHPDQETRDALRAVVEADDEVRETAREVLSTMERRS